MIDPEQFETRIKQMSTEQVLAESNRIMLLTKKDPKNPILHYYHGLLLAHSKSYASAAKSLQRAHGLAPKSEPVLKTLTEIFMMETHKYREALKYLKKWALLRKDLVELPVFIAKCQLQLGKPHDAMESLAKAEMINPDEPSICATRADIYSQLGDSVNAIKELESYLAIGDDPTIASRLLYLPDYQPTEAQISQIHSMTEETLDPGKRSVGYSNMGIALERMGDYVRSFECFRKQNDILRPNLNRERELAVFKNLKEAFTKQFLVERSGAGDQSDKPIFVLGMPRSGTTLIESILAAHPKIVDNGELAFFYNELKKRGMNLKRQDLIGNRTPNLATYLQYAPPDAFKELAQAYFAAPGYQKGSSKYQVDKLPHNFLAIGLIHLTFPNATIIHCRRHPVDCAFSCYKSSFSEYHAYATDLEFLGVYYRQYWELMQHWRDVLPGRMFELYYEDTVANTETVARAMIDHIGLEWDDRCLDHTKSKKTVKTASQWQVRQPIYTSSVAKWKHYEDGLQPMIKAMGSIVGTYEEELAALRRGADVS